MEVKKLTFKELKELIEKNEIFEDVILRSDSGWECGPTDIGGVWYSWINNEIIFTQFPNDDEEERKQNGYILLE